jgi:hypothetical protein
MIKKWIFAAGAGIGYVLGTRAGRQKYDAMVGKAREVMERPEVKEATEAIQAQANRLYDDGKQMVRDRAHDLRARAQHRRTHSDAELDSGLTTTYAPGAPLAPVELEPMSEKR